MDRALLQRLKGERVAIPSHDTRVLAGEPALWLMETGSVAVSCAEVEAGAPVGPRHFLFRGGASQPMWVVPHGPERKLRLLAVPIEDAAVRVVPIEDVWAVLAESPDAAEPLFSVWTEALTEQMLERLPPGNAVAINKPRELTLDEGEAARVTQSGLWVAVDEGEVSVRGDAAWVRGAGDGPLPWTKELWLVASAGARLRVMRTSQLPDSGSAVAGLAALEQIFLHDMAAQSEAELEADVERLRTRAARQSDLVDRAAGDLADSFETGQVTKQRATPLLTAVGAICDTLKVKVRTPAASEQARDAAAAVDGIARASGVRVRRVLLEGNWTKDDCGPLLAFRGEEQEPVALLVGKRQRYEIIDPVDGSRKPLTPEVEATLQPEAVAWYRPMPPRKLKLWDLFRFSMHGRAGDLLIMAATALCATLLGMVTPKATQLVMDSAIPEANRSLLWELGFVLLATGVGGVIFSTSQSYISIRMATRARQAGQSAIWDRLLGMRPTFFRKFSSGDLMDRAMSVSEIGDQLTGATLTGLFSAMMALLNLALLYHYSSKLAMIAVVVAVLTAVLTTTCAWLIRKSAIALQDLGGKFAGFQIQVVQGVPKLRVGGAEARAYAQWMHRFAEQQRLILRVTAIEDRARVCNLLLSSLSTVAIFWFGYALLKAGPGGMGMSLGIFLAFFTAYGTFLGGANGVSNTLIGLFDVLAASKRLKPILEEEPEADPALSDPGRLSGRFAAENLTFRYRDDGPTILEDLTVKAEPGEFVAIVGSSGSGKSTLLRLLLGFERPEAGAVYYDGMDLSGLDLRGVRTQLGIVLQGGRLTQGTIMENIATGIQAPLDEVLEAVNMAGFAEDLEDLPMGIHTVVSEGGTTLSGGQVQRLMIARALVYKPKLIFFDEATSALDNRTQAIVSASLEKMKVTRLVIAHRLSTIRNADRIYVLDQGRVVEFGTYDELKDSGGVFSRMMARQMA